MRRVAEFSGGKVPSVCKGFCLVSAVCTGGSNPPVSAVKSQVRRGSATRSYRGPPMRYHGTVQLGMTNQLDDIRQRAEASKPLCDSSCPSEECGASYDRARLLAALDAVLAIADDLISDITGADGVENEAQDEIRDQIAGRIRAAVNDALEAEAIRAGAE